MMAIANRKRKKNKKKQKKRKSLTGARDLQQYRRLKYDFGMKESLRATEEEAERKAADARRKLNYVSAFKRMLTCNEPQVTN